VASGLGEPEVPPAIARRRRWGRQRAPFGGWGV